MSNARHHKIDSDQPTVYQLRLKGHLGPQWADWFGGLAITSADNSDTLLTGPGGSVRRRIAGPSRLRGKEVGLIQLCARRAPAEGDPYRHCYSAPWLTM